MTALPSGDDASARVVEKIKGKKTKFLLTIPKDGGQFVFGVFVVKKDDSTGTMANVYNYLIDFVGKK